MPFLSYTIFADAACTKFDRVIDLAGNKAVEVLRAFERDLHREPKVGDKLYGCRIDRIGSEEYSEAAE